MLNFCLLTVSGIMAIVYGLYTFGILGSNNNKLCVTNAVDFHPYAFAN